MNGHGYQLDATWDDNGSAYPEYFNLKFSQMQKIQYHQLDTLPSKIIKKLNGESSELSYLNIFGTLPIGRPFTYQEFNNFERDFNDPENAEIYTYE